MEYDIPGLLHDLFFILADKKEYLPPLVSIIIPTYNRAGLLRDTLDSILDQHYSNWECLVIDDGSTDDTNGIMQEYCHKDARFSYHQRPQNRVKGANACRNYGFELSRGEYINWFDSDDIMHPEKLEIQLKILEEKNSSLCVCQTQVFEGSIENNLGLRHPRIISDNFWEDYLMFKILWLTQAPLWKREFLERLDYLFDEELQAAQEWEFHLRALSLLKSYSTIDTPLVYLRLHEKSISKENREKVLWNYFLARYKIYKYFYKVLSPKAESFLRRYFLEAYKNSLRNQQMRLAGRIWKKYILRSMHISIFSKLRLSLGYLSFLLTKKGDLFIAYIN